MGAITTAVHLWSAGRFLTAQWGALHGSTSLLCVSTVVHTHIYIVAPPVVLCPYQSRRPSLPAIPTAGWFFGRDTYAALVAAGKARPIGLIGVYRGGSADELWSTSDALDKCLDPDAPRDPTFSTLWNGMISPLLQTTIKGAIW